MTLSEADSIQNNELTNRNKTTTASAASSLLSFSLTTDTSLHLELPGRGSIKERIQQIFVRQTLKA